MSYELEQIYTWWFDSASLFLRYFLLAGAGYFVFYFWKKNRFSNIKIQKKNPSGSAIQKEIINSISTILIFCGTSWMVFQWQKSGITKIYLDIHQFGYAYFIFSIIIMVIIHDAYFYWTHRFMHMPKIFTWVHRTHHLSDNPTPWTAFSFHPLEAIIAIGIIPIIVFILPCHPFAIFTFLTYMTLINVMGHLGYETFPYKFRQSKLGKWQNTSTNHDYHHQHARYNFGLYFTFWDKFMNTYKSNDKRI
ncbi:sterol desaturase family protein [soil metagenome]